MDESKEEDKSGGERLGRCNASLGAMQHSAQKGLWDRE